MNALHFSNFLSFSMSPIEILIRGTIMYWCLFLLLRFLLRRDTGSAGISGILFVVLLGDAAQNAMIEKRSHRRRRRPPHRNARGVEPAARLARHPFQDDRAAHRSAADPAGPQRPGRRPQHAA